MQKTIYKALILHIFILLSCALPTPKADVPSETKKLKEAPQLKEQEAKSATVDKKTEDLKNRDTKKSLLEEIEQKYASATAVSMEVKKTLTLKLLEQDRTQEGTLELKKTGRFRLELSGAEKSLAITDGKTIWVVSYPTDPEFDNIIRVVKSSNPKRIQSQALLAFLLGKGSLLKHFVIKDKKEEDEKVVYFLEALENQEDMKKLMLVVEKNKKEILRASYADSLENETSFEFKKTDFKAKIKDSRFKFQIPKGAEVTEL